MRARQWMAIMVAAGCAGAPLLASTAADAAPAPLPSLFDDEAVTVKQVLSARDVLVARADGSTQLVRFPGVTVPGTLPDGSPACGSAAARQALAELLPVGRKVTMASVARDQYISWSPLSRAQSEAPQLAADGAFYADLTSDARVLDDLEGRLLDALARDGWLRPGTPLNDAIADPSEQGFLDLDRFTDTFLYANDAELAHRGVYGQCAGDFAAASPAAVAPTNWTIDRSGRVRAVGDAKIAAGLTGAQLAARFGTPAISVNDNACELRWPSRGITASPLGWTTDRGKSVAPPGRDPTACLARRITDLRQTGPASRVNGLRPSVSSARLKRSIPVLRSDGERPRSLIAGRPYASRGFLLMGLDAKDRFQQILATLPTQ